MELTPQALNAVEFREARRGGYNTRDVDEFIERVASAAGQLHDRLREALARAEAAEGRLADAQRRAEDAQRRPAEAHDSDETLRRTLVLAQRTADATINEAKDEASRLLSEAREEAARTRSHAEAEARRGAEGARRDAEAEIDDLVASRDGLRADIEALGDRLEEQRSHIRAGIAELQRVVDDPEALKPMPVPSSTDAMGAAPGTEERPPQPAPVGEAPPPGPPLPPLPQRGAVAAADEAGNTNGGGSTVPAPPAISGAPFAALSEPPSIDLEPPEVDVGASPVDRPPPPTPPVPFGFTPPDAGDGWPPDDGRDPSADDALGPPAVDDLPPPLQFRKPTTPPDIDAPDDGLPIEPGTRPSEWGRAVFDPDTDSDSDDQEPRFGRRR